MLEAHVFGKLVQDVEHAKSSSQTGSSVRFSGAVERHLQVFVAPCFKDAHPGHFEVLMKGTKHSAKHSPSSGLLSPGCFHIVDGRKPPDKASAQAWELVGDSTAASKKKRIIDLHNLQEMLGRTS
jgi:hypothetical protein